MVKMEWVLENEDGMLLENDKGQVMVFETREDAVHCVDAGRTYVDLDYSHIVERIIFPDGGRETYDRNKIYFS